MRHEVAVDTKIAAAHETWTKLHARYERIKHATWVPEAEKATAKAATEEALAAYNEATEEYEGWTRFFLVPKGHIHGTLNCPTWHRGHGMTTFHWLPELGGLTEADAVAEFGAILCTVCFPTAPVEWTGGENLKDKDERIERELKRERAKLPEVKKAATKAALVERKRLRVRDLERAIVERDRELLLDPESTNWRIAAGAAAEAELPKVRKQLARAEAALAELAEAAEVAAAAAGL